MGLTKITDNNFINIQGFMRTQLDLKGNELLIYAIIYGFSQDGENKYKGSLSYLSELSGASQKTVISTLQKLCDKELLIKKGRIFNGVKYCEYQANLSAVKITPPSVKITQGYVKTTQPYVKTTDNNNINNKINNNKKDNLDKSKLSKKSEIKKSTSRKTKKEKYLDKVLGKLEEFDFSEKEKEKIIDFYSDRIEKNDYPADNQLDLALSNLADMDNRLQVINNSIANGYKGFFPVKQSNRQSYRLKTQDTETIEEHNNRVSNYETNYPNTF